MTKTFGKLPTVSYTHLDVYKRQAPTPTNISTKSEPEIEKNGTFASPATAFARSVFPVPGGPTKRTPLGILAPIAVYLPCLLYTSYQ